MNFFKRNGNGIRKMDSLTKIVMAVFLVLAIITSIVTFNFIRGFTTGMTILDLPGAPILDAITGNKDGGGLGQSGSTAGVATPEPWDGKSRDSADHGPGL